ncbi:hypothetical protein EV360DRAFT_87605 [Lentinula raphanica]|nr:hypothetical protein EV360DRAFT_87605 [Lentinula raphanica]
MRTRIVTHRGVAKGVIIRHPSGTPLSSALISTLVCNAAATADASKHSFTLPHTVFSPLSSYCLPPALPSMLFLLIFLLFSLFIYPRMFMSEVIVRLRLHSSSSSSLSSSRAHPRLWAWAQVHLSKAASGVGAVTGGAFC